MRLAYGIRLSPSPLEKDRKDGARELPDGEVRRRVNQQFKIHFPVSSTNAGDISTSVGVQQEEQEDKTTADSSTREAKKNTKLRVLCVFNKRHTVEDALVYYTAEKKYRHRFVFTYLKDWGLLKMPEQLELVGSLVFDEGR